MNKKVSTILTLSLMLGGSLLSSSAFAEELHIGNIVSKENPLKADGKTTYFIVQDGGASSITNQKVLGMQWGGTDPLEQKEVQFLVRSANDDITGSHDRFLWTVTSHNDGGKYSYEFTNVATGQKLVVDNNSGAFNQMETDVPVDSNDAVEFSFGDGQKSYENGPEGVNYRLLITTTLNNGNPNDDKALFLDSSNQINVVGKTDESANIFNLYSVEDNEVSEPEDLNDLYNSAGFNFEIQEGVDNIFANGKIKALNVGATDAVWGDNNEYSFPAGTYFAVSTPAGSYSNATDKKEYLMQCTFIAVSPVNNVADDADEQAAGRGFTLTTISGKDLNCYTEVRPGAIIADEQTEGNEVSVFNACFEGWENHGVAGKYALALSKVRYKKEAASDKPTHVEAKLSLNVISVHYGSTKYLATANYASNNFVFTLAKTSAIDPTTILSESGASIYNIKFVSNEEDGDEGEYGKYLTIATNSSKEYWAKGSALADLNTPAYQFVISKVVDKNITFTNRETGEHFTTALYPEEGGAYSISISGNKNLEVADIEEDNDVIKSTTTTMNETLIELVPVANVDMFDGFLNVEDETIMTMAFARDYTPTSNKLYPIVNSSNTFPTSGDKLTEDASESVEWQLVKADKKPAYQTYDYYYLKDGKATIKHLGDTVAVQPYYLQLVKDGKVENKYININKTTHAVTLSSTATDVYIKNNVDGSVAIKTAIDGDYYLSVNDYEKEYGTNSSDFNEEDQIEMNAVLNQPKAISIKTYLVSDSPIISWENQGHVTLQTEMGIYITKAEDNSGIVNSNESETFYLTKTDTKKAIPSFYISKGINGDAATERMYLFNPVDSIPYLVNAPVDTRYEWDEETTKAIFKAGTLLTPDTMKTIIKGDETVIAQEANNDGVEEGLNRFKFQIIETEDDDAYYYIRQVDADRDGNTMYLRNLNGKLTWTKSSATKAERVKVAIEEVAAPTANESVSASEVKVIAVDGAINIKNAAGKNVVVSTILGQIVANEVLTSDNATISVPAGIAIVSVDGEEAVKVSVR